jgi:hypothetical protein
MKPIRILIFFSLNIILLITGCKKSIPTPDVATLSSPSNSAACLSGISASDTTASVTFTWSTSNNADSYQIIIQNLTKRNSVSYTTNSTSYNALLTTNTAYSWYVIATNQTGKSTSDTWKFYLTGTPASNYAPFPADLTAPASGATISSNSAASVQVTFQWAGSDPDNDLASYTFYLDNTNASTKVVDSQTTNTIKQTLTSGNTYYWKVVTIDKVGNTSTSVINSFIIK